MLIILIVLIFDDRMSHLSRCVHMNFIKRAMTIIISISVLFFGKQQKMIFFTIAPLRRAYELFVFDTYKRKGNNEALRLTKCRKTKIFLNTRFISLLFTTFWESNKAMILQLHTISVWHDFKLILSRWAFVWRVRAPHKHNKYANELRMRCDG